MQTRRSTGHTRWLVTGVLCVVLFGGGRASAQQPGESRGFWSRLWGTTPAGISDEQGAWRGIGDGMKQIWTTGGSDLFVPGYIWHTPWMYSEEQLARYNTIAWGAGFGRTLRSTNHRPRTLYAMVSADSYDRPEYMLGYAWRARWRPGDGAFSVGGGYTALLIGRADKLNYTPLPLVLPLGSVGFDRVELMGTYIPFYEVGYFFLRLNFTNGRIAGSQK